MLYLATLLRLHSNQGKIRKQIEEKKNVKKEVAMGYLHSNYNSFAVTLSICCLLSCQFSNAFVSPQIRTNAARSMIMNPYQHGSILNRHRYVNVARKMNQNFVLYDSNDNNIENNTKQGMSNFTQDEENIISLTSAEIGEQSMNQPSNTGFNVLMRWYQSIKELTKNATLTSSTSPPPIQIQDVSLLYYDIFLIINLSVSISFWVVHRLSFFHIMDAFSEGCLLSILWIISGLYYGSFLYSAIDGHYDISKEENINKGYGGPKSAGLLGLWTFVGTINLRMVVALMIAVVEHRQVGSADGEELIPLELCFGLVLMSMWRMLHSAYSRV